MANVRNADADVGTSYWTLDTTGDIDLGTISPTGPGKAIIQVSGITAGGGNIAPKLRLIGAAAVSVTPVACAYYNCQTGADIASGTNITTDGNYAVYADGGQEVRLSYTHVGGTVKLLVRRAVA